MLDDSLAKSRAVPLSDYPRVILSAASLEAAGWKLREECGEGIGPQTTDMTLRDIAIDVVREALTVAGIQVVLADD